MTGIVLLYSHFLNDSLFFSLSLSFLFDINIFLFQFQMLESCLEDVRHVTYFQNKDIVITLFFKIGISRERKSRQHCFGWLTKVVEQNVNLVEVLEVNDFWPEKR